MDRPSQPSSHHRDEQRLQEMVRRFLEAWNNAADVDLRRFLPPADDPIYRTALVELIKTDLRIRWQKKHGKPLESYVERFPELGSLAELPPELLLEEYLARLRFGQPPALESYRERFPRQFPAFEQLARENPTRNDVKDTAGGLAGLPPAIPCLGAAPGQTLETAGGYRLLKRIGQGSFAEVWQGVAPGGFPVAIKRILRPLDDDEAKREQQALERIKELRHPFLLQTHSSFMVENHLFVVMELADGTLRDRMRSGQQTGQGLVPLPELLRYFREAAEALDYMHGQHVMHRDIKPQNILLLHGHAKVADFGLATLQASQRAMMTATGCGTPAYMAPEVWRGRVGPASDQYSLACAFVEQRLGRLPFPGTDLVSLMTAHLSQTPNLTALPAAEQEVLNKVLAKVPEQRYPSCQEFVRALEHALRDQMRLSDPSFQMSVGSNETLGPHSHGRPRSRSKTQPMQASARATRTMAKEAPPPRRWLPVGLLLLLLLALAGGGWFVWQSMQPSFALEVPAKVMLKAGEVKPVRVTVQRKNFSKPVTLSCEGLPANCTMKAEPPSDNQSSIDVSLIAAPDAPQGTAKVTVRATGDIGTQAGELELTIAGQAYPLPGGWKKPAEATIQLADGRAYYDKIDVVRGGIPVRFLLIRKSDRNDPDTFYIMEDKVWVALFEKFAAEKLQILPPDKRPWEQLPPWNKSPDNPIMGVPAPVAYRCAEWLGGKLPMPAQWDKAAGRFEKKRGKGPYLEPYQKNEIAVDRPTEGPMPVGKAIKDRSPFHCHDMAGNGLEWTGKAVGDVGDDPRKRSQAADLTGSRIVWIRGQRYSDDGPLQYDQIVDDPALGRALPAEPERPNGTIGFRVVLELEP